MRITPEKLHKKLRWPSPPMHLGDLPKDRVARLVAPDRLRNRANPVNPHL